MQISMISKFDIYSMYLGRYICIKTTEYSRKRTARGGGERDINSTVG